MSSVELEKSKCSMVLFFYSFDSTIYCHLIQKTLKNKEKYCELHTDNCQHTCICTSSQKNQVAKTDTRRKRTPIFLKI